MAILFQYGSNCDEDQLNGTDRLCGDARFIGIAQTTSNFKLVFDVWASGRGCAAADLVETPGQRVWGVLYDVPDYLITRETAHAKGRKAMDDIEGEGTVYRRESIQVRTAEGTDVTALTYRVIDRKEGLKTNARYVGYIVKGLRDHGIEPSYIEDVKATAIANNPEIADEIARL
jgi:hypothetical protein